MNKTDASHRIDKIFQDYESRMEEHDRKIDKAFKEISSRRKKSAVVMLVLWATLCGLGYYLFKM